VAEELGVRYVLEGSIRRVNDKIRINAQLVDGVTGGHVWADRFDGVMADVFALQDHVNKEIVAALEVSLTAAEKRNLDKVETASPEAYDILLRGVEQYQRFNAQSMVQARRLFEQAAEIDPGYARAYANIALTHATEVNFYWSLDREESIRQGLYYATRAMELDDSIPQIYMTRSSLYLSQRQHQAAVEAARRTIEVHPNYADGHATLAFILSYSGQLEPALEALDRARQINPRSTGVYLGIEGRILFLLGRYEEALVVLENSVERNPGFDSNPRGRAPRCALYAPERRRTLYRGAAYCGVARVTGAGGANAKPAARDRLLTPGNGREERDFVAIADFGRGFAHLLVDRDQDPGAAVEGAGERFAARAQQRYQGFHRVTVRG
jgi:tetratricopeptide (TPR) repeat protein